MAEKYVYVSKDMLAYFFNKIQPMFTHLGSYTTRIPIEGWVTDDEGCHVDIPFEKIKPTDVPIIDIEQTGDEDTDYFIRDAWSTITRITTSEGKITVYAYGVPSVEIPIQMKVVK